MYSTDGGEFHYHTKSHLTKLIAFFILMLAISFFNIKFWHFCSYFLYGIIILLLIWVSIYGIKASGSQRWINLYFLVLQPSELMKIGIILCLAKYYHRLSPEKVNSFVSISIPLTLIIIPIIFVLSQPDLGTSILIASSGLIILWLGGIKIKYFFVSLIAFLISLPFIITYSRTLSKIKDLNFFRP
jgi:rod shape determining protein RodA